MPGPNASTLVFFLAVCLAVQRERVSVVYLSQCSPLTPWLPPRFERPLPPFFISCGEKDPVLTDSVDLDAALRALGVDVELRTYEGELHAFQALPWRPHERASWEHLFAFLDARRSAP